MLDGGSAGATFVNEDPDDLAVQLLALLADPDRRRALGERGRRRADRFDWSVVASDVMAVYETITEGAGRVRPTPEGMSRWSRLLRAGRGGER